MVNRQVNRREKGRGQSQFVYREYLDPKKMKERAERTGGNFESIFISGIDQFKPKSGDNQVRILPPTWKNHDHFGYQIWVHGFVGADKSSYLCPKKMLNKPCPLCKEAQKLKDAGEAEEADQVRAKERYIYWVLDREGDDPTHPIVWSVAWTLDKEIAAQCSSKKTGKVLLLDHPTEGYDLFFTKTGKNLNTRYVGVKADREQSPIADSKADREEILAFVTENPLDAILKFYDAEKLDQVLDGAEAASDKDKELDDEEEDDRPRKARRNGSDEDEEDDRPRKARRNRDEDEEESDRPSRRGRASGGDEEEETSDGGRDEEDEEEDDRKTSRRVKSRRDEDEEEEERPRGRAKSKARDEEEDDPAEEDEDTGDPDEDEEEAKPRRSKSRSRDEDEDEDDRPRRRRAA